MIYRKDNEFHGRRMEVPFDVKADEITPTGRFKGYASVFNVVDQGGDNVQPGAFIDGLVKAKNDGRFIPMLWQHDRMEPIGTFPDMAEDTKGLFVEGQLVLEDNPPAKRAFSLLKNKALGGMSIGYRIAPGGIAEDPKKRGVYLLSKVDLIEVSLVTMPMLIQARVQEVKSLLEGGANPSVGDLVGVLRELGWTEEMAKAIGEVSRPILEAGGVKEKDLVSDVAAFYKHLASRVPSAD